MESRCDYNCEPRDITDPSEMINPHVVGDIGTTLTSVRKTETIPP